MDVIESLHLVKGLLKYKDPRRPLLNGIIYKTLDVLSKVIVDLGFGVSIIPFSVYRRLGHIAIQPLSLTVQLDY